MATEKIGWGIIDCGVIAPIHAADGPGIYPLQTWPEW